MIESNLKDYIIVAFQLSDLGFDVWLGNSRGNTYSRKHVSLNADEDLGYWNFSYVTIIEQLFDLEKLKSNETNRVKTKWCPFFIRWDEMGKYDIPAVIKYVLKTTGRQKMIYIGHSLGCAMFFIAMIDHPKLNDKIELMIALAPASSMAYFKNYLRLFSPFVDQIAVMLISCNII